MKIRSLLRKSRFHTRVFGTEWSLKRWEKKTPGKDVTPRDFRNDEGIVSIKQNGKQFRAATLVYPLRKQAIYLDPGDVATWIFLPFRIPIGLWHRFHENKHVRQTALHLEHDIPLNSRSPLAFFAENAVFNRTYSKKKQNNQPLLTLSTTFSHGTPPIFDFEYHKVIRHAIEEAFPTKRNWQRAVLRLFRDKKMRPALEALNMGDFRMLTSTEINRTNHAMSKVLRFLAYEAKRQNQK